MSTHLVYVVVGSREEAMHIAHAVVAERLAACANLHGAISSVYWWEGALQEATEWPLFLKTSENCLERLISRVVELHSYECPCVIALPVMHGHEDYLTWIHSESAVPGAD